MPEAWEQMVTCVYGKYFGWETKGTVYCRYLGLGDKGDRAWYILGAGKQKEPCLVGT